MLPLSCLVTSLALKFVLSLLAADVAFAVVLSGAFLAHALILMNKASMLDAGDTARFGTPIDDMGIAIGVMIAALGILLVCIR